MIRHALKRSPQCRPFKPSSEADCSRNASNVVTIRTEGHRITALAYLSFIRQSFLLAVAYVQELRVAGRESKVIHKIQSLFGQTISDDRTYEVAISPPPGSVYQFALSPD